MQLTNPQWAEFNAKVIEEFRANAGRCGGYFEGSPLLLLTTQGARTGREHVTPLTYTRDGERLVVVASKGGAPSDPDWYRNLIAHPEVVVEIDTERFDARATPAEPGERERLFEQIVLQRPRFGEYRRATDRVIPVVILELIL